MASLCGLSQFVATQVSTDLALWYSASSGYLNNPVEKDTFRFHLYNMDTIAKLIELLDYPLHEGFQRHYKRTLALHHFMDRMKRSSASHKKNLQNLFRGLYQKGFFVDTANLDKKFKGTEVCTAFIPVDGPADEQQLKEVYARLPPFCKNMPREDLLYVYSLLD